MEKFKGVPKEFSENEERESDKLERQAGGIENMLEEARGMLAQAEQALAESRARLERAKEAGGSITLPEMEYRAAQRFLETAQENFSSVLEFAQEIETLREIENEMKGSQEGEDEDAPHTLH